MLELAKGKLSGIVATALVAAYAVLFSVAVPSGDGYRNEARLRGELFALDPNHLLFDPIIAASIRILEFTGIGYQPFLAFRLVSAISAIVALVLFVQLLRAVYINSGTIILLATAGLFASHSFLSLTLSDEPFLVQIPFLIAAIFSLAVWKEGVGDLGSKNGGVRSLFFAGVFFGLACLISIHNVVWAGLIAIFLMFRWAKANIVASVASYASGGLIIAIPAFVIAYSISSTDATFFDWITSHQSGASSGDSELYRLALTTKGLLVAFTRVLAALSNSFIADGGLAAYAKFSLFAGEFDYKPSTVRLAAGAVLLIAIGSIVIWSMIVSVRSQIDSIFLALLISAVLAYGLFGIYWSGKGHQFWAAVIVPFWLWVAAVANGRPGNQSGERRSAANLGKYRVGLSMLIAVIGVGNVALSIAPRSFFDADAARQEYRALVDGADVLIVPGWDINWVLEVHREIEGEVYHLFEMALDNGMEPPLENLSDIVSQNVAQGKLVLVSRLFDLDQEQKPWGNLRTYGWPREKLIDQFDGFCAVPIGSASGIVVRKISECAAGSEDYWPH